MILTDGRYSGVSYGAAIGHITPEAKRGGGILYLQTGDVIYAANRQVISGVAQLRQTLGAMKSEQAVVLLVERSGHLIYVPLELD